MWNEHRDSWLLETQTRYLHYNNIIPSQNTAFMWIPALMRKNTGNDISKIRLLRRPWIWFFAGFPVLIPLQTEALAHDSKWNLSIMVLLIARLSSLPMQHWQKKLNIAHRSVKLVRVAKILSGRDWIALEAKSLWNNRNKHISGSSFETIVLILQCG